jgi:hypothetical protein
MSRRNRRGLVLFSALTLLATAGASRLPAATDHSTLSGAWTLNREMSDLRPPSTPGGGDDVPSATPPGGGFGPGGMGGFGGYGGRRGIGGPGPDMSKPPDPERMKRVEAMMRELFDAPPSFVVSASGGAVSFTDADGRTQTFATTGKKEKHQLDAGIIETRTKWDQDVLVKKISLGSGPDVTETYNVLETGQLQVVLKVGGDRSGVRPVRRVYDKREGQ